MTVRATPLSQSSFVPAVEGDVYVAGVTTIIDKCSSSAVLAGIVTLRIVPALALSTAAHQQAKKQFVVDESYTWPEIANQVLLAGDKITAVCSVADAVTLRLSGRQVTSP